MLIEMANQAIEYRLSANLSLQNLSEFIILPKFSVSLQYENVSEENLN